MDLGLKDRVALIAAGSRGLGRAVAEELAAEGVSLVLCAREPRTLAETAAAIAESSGAHVLAVPADVTVVDDITRLVEAGNERFGRIDILVTNAGGPPAFVTRISMRPNLSLPASTRRVISSTTVTSAGTASTCVPLLSAIAAAVSASVRGSRAQSTSETPSAASSSATARPSPRLPAAISATLSLSPRSMGYFCLR